MTTYTVTLSNWNDPSFWSSVSETTSGHVLDFSALGSAFTLELDQATGLLVINDGAASFAIGEPGNGAADATLGGSTDFAYFTSVMGSQGSDQVEGTTGNDSLTAGSGGSNNLLGGDGSDTLVGSTGGGSSIMKGGDGADLIDGSSGSYDVASYYNSSNSVHVDMTDGSSESGGEAAGDTLVGIEQLDGSNAAGDTLVGDGGAGQIKGWGGDDLISTTHATGALIYGGAGSDSITGAGGADTIHGDGGGAVGSADSISGGAGADSISGGAGADTILGGDGDDTIEGGEGDDSIVGGDGNDLLRTGSGQDTLEGGEGNDTLLNSAGDDSLVGGVGDDSIVASAGDDTLDGGEGNDTLIGGGDNDLILGGGGADSIRGDDDITYEVPVYQMGVDFTLNSGTFEGGANSITLSVLGRSTATFLDDDGQIGGDTPNETFTDAGQLVVINDVAYQVLFDDTAQFSNDATGDIYTFAILDADLDASGESAQAGEDGTFLIQIGGPTIPPGADLTAVNGTTIGSPSHYDLTPYQTGGADSIDAGSGNDTVTGEFGNDTIAGGAGADSLDGGEGDDILSGGSESDTLLGGIGNDSLSGGGGADTLSGGTGADSLSGGADADSLDGGDDNDTLFGDLGADTLQGGAGADSLFGGDDADRFVIQDGFGNDTIFGGVGGTDFDTIDLSALSVPVTVTYTGDKAGTITDGTHTIIFSQVEHLILTDLADVVNAGSDTLGVSIEGGDGNDTITTGTGNDTLFYGNGDNVISTGAGNDYVDDEAGNPGYTGANSVDLGDGNDTIYSGYGDDTILGGQGDDQIYAQWGNDSVDGGLGNDLITSEDGNAFMAGGAGSDTIQGATGNDTIEGGAGNDSLTGGADTDTFVLTSGGGNDTITDFDTGDTDSDGVFNDQLDATGLTGGTGAGGSLRVQDVVVSDDGFGNALLTFPNGETVLLQGVAPSQIDSTSELRSAGIACFAAGTRIDTPQGPIPVQNLRPGALVSTRDAGPQPVLWIGERHLSPADLHRDPAQRPIKIRKGVLGNTRPLWVSPQHGLLLDGFGKPRFARAKHLAKCLSGVHIDRSGRGVSYYHLLCPRHSVLTAEGIPTESFYPGPEGLFAYRPLDLVALTRVLPGILTGKVSDIYGPTAYPFLRGRDVFRYVPLMETAL